MARWSEVGLLSAWTKVTGAGKVGPRPPGCSTIGPGLAKAGRTLACSSLAGYWQRNTTSAVARWPSHL